MRFAMTIARRASWLAAAFGLCFLATIGPSLADGGDSKGGNSSSMSCPRGEIWDAKSSKCVKQQSGILPDKALTDYAFSLAQAGRFDEALDVLNLLKNPNTAVALNYRGYITRQLGGLDQGIALYLRSIALDPRYAQVREYLGEAYVLKGDYARAKAQLRAIKGICGTDCAAYEHLVRWIEEGPPACGSRYAGGRCPS